MAKDKQEAKSEPKEQKKPAPLIEAVGMARTPTGYVAYVVTLPADSPHVQYFSGRFKGALKAVPYKNAMDAMTITGAKLFLPGNIKRAT